MGDTTTINITTDQKDRLDERKRHDREPYKDVMERLLDGEPRLEASTECKFGDGGDMAEALAAIENSVETVEERTGKIERVLEGLQG